MIFLKEKKIKLNKDTIYNITFVIWVINSVLQSTTMQDSYALCGRIIDAFVLVTLIFQIVNNTYKIRELIVIVLVLTTMAISAINSQTYYFVSALLLVIAAHGRTLDSIIVIWYRTVKIMMLIVLALYGCHILHDNLGVRLDGRLRYSLGFSHPNRLAAYVLLLMFMRFYIKRDALKTKDYLMAIGAAAFIYWIPNSKSAFVVIVGLMLYVFFYNASKSWSDKIKQTIYSILIMLAIIANIGSVFLSTRSIQNGILLRLNDFISDRFAAGYKSYQIWDISVWGQYINTQDAALKARYGHIFLDNAYMTLLVRFGIATYIVVSVLLICVMIYFKNNKLYFLCGIMVIYALYGITESYLFYLGESYALFTLGYIIFKDRPSIKSTPK